jgi:hypothetical protein
MGEKDSSFYHSFRQTLSMAKKGHSKLVENASRAPNVDWIRSYFELAEELLSETGLRNDDPRLVMSLPESGSIPITVNNRYVLVAYRNEPSRTEFILPSNQGAVNSYLQQANRKGQFGTINDEDESKRPWFVGFDGDPQRLVDEEFKRLWLSAINREVKRAEQSPYRRYHEPAVFRAARDNDYREQVIEEAFE